MKVADLAAGVTLGGRFRLHCILGRGSYGDVWLADTLQQDDLPSQVALKIYQQAQQNRATQVLLKEANTALGFDDPHLVRVFGAERVDGLVVMWMEYVPGDTLLDRLGTEEAPRPVSLDEALSWLRDIAEALAYLHAQDPPCVHGDLKLDNVLLDPDGMARLVDFGQSRLIEDRFVATDGTGAFPYLAPEVLGRSMDTQGKRYVTTDIYAAGVIAYRLLTGRFPRRTMHEIFNQTPFPRPCELNPSVPQPLEALVLKCLEKKPENRYATGAVLLNAVEDIQTSLVSIGQQELSLPTAPGERIPTVAEELIAFTKDLVEQGKVEEAAARLEQAMERMSTSPRVLLVYAVIACQVGKFDAARIVYQRAIRWLRNHNASDDDLRDAIEGKGSVDIRLKQYEDAVEAFRWLAERWPDKHLYRYRHAVALGLAGHYRDSLRLLQDMHEEGPASALLCAKVGFAHLQLRNAALASQYFNEALMLDAFEPQALYHMARLRAIEGDLDRAEKYLERLRQVDETESQVKELERLLYGPGGRQR